MRYFGTLQLLAIVFSLVAPPVARAADAIDPQALENELEVTLELQGFYDWSDSGPDFETEASLNVDTEISLTETLQLISEVKLIAMASGEDANQDRSIGVEFDDFYFQYERGNWIVAAGRFTPIFGLANELELGLFGDDFTSDYELENQLGLAGTIYWATPTMGRTELQVAVFTTDRSILSGSLIDPGSRLTLADGGPSNTAGLQSFSAAVTGSQIPGLPDTAYYFGYQQQAPGQDDSLWMRGVTAGIFRELHFENPLLRNVEAWFELTRIQNLDSQRIDRNYGTLGLSLDQDDWSTSFTATLAQSDGADADSTDLNWLVQIAAEFEIREETSLELSIGGKNLSGKTGPMFGFNLSSDLY